MRIKRQSRLIRANCALHIGIFQIVLPVASEEIPVASVVVLKLGSAVIALRRVLFCVVHRKGVAETGVGETGGNYQREQDEKPACRRTGEAKNHPAILCIDKLSDAS